MCIDSDGNDDGGWNDEGCFENGEWYCLGCDLFFNECEYYECTEDGWAGPFENPGCNDGIECLELDENGCILSLIHI